MSDYTDDELRAAAARALGWQPFDFQGETIWLDHDKQPRGVSTPSLTWATAGALLELCETPSCDGKLVLFVGGESARAEIGVWYGGASAFSIYEIKPRNVIIACLIALGAIEPKP